MKKTSIIIGLMILSLCLKSQKLWQLYSDSIISYDLEMNDDFNGAGLDQTKWLPNLPWSRTIWHQDLAFTEKNISIKDGLIKFTLSNPDSLIQLGAWEIDSNYIKKNNIKLNEENKYRFKYNAGILWSKQNYSYGYYEIKFKSSKAQGSWPAFWLYGGNPNYEIDFFELKGERKNQIHVDVHCPDGCGNFKQGPLGYYRKSFGHWVDTKVELAEGFNVLAGEWTEKYVKWYLNGKLIAYYDKAPMNVTMALSMGTSVAKTGGAFSPGPNKSSKFPDEFVVDYVSVWKKTSEFNRKNFEFIYHEKELQNKTPFAEKLQMNSKKKKKAKFYKKQTAKHANLITVSMRQIENTNFLQINVFGDNINTAEVNFKTNDGLTIFVAPLKLQVGENQIDLATFRTKGERIIEIKINDKIFTEKILIK